ncbi:MAG: methyltransferase domain-containing protein [Phycisphaerae bacterium]|nr:methyltransferase domain-containing protein [Phycisphaerae bacterium]
MASRYDASYDDAYWQWHDSLTWDHIKPHLPPESHACVLDLGCGTGKWAARLLQAGYAVTCVDISGAMVEQARKKLGALAGAERASFVQADLVDLSELPTDHFRLALALGDPIGCTSAPGRALKEIRKRLVDGGVLIATFDNRLSAVDYYLQQGDPRALEAFLRTGKTRWLTKDKEERFEIHTYTPLQVRKLLESVGFEIVGLIGKTVLPMRHHRALLDTSQRRRHWAKIEKSLCRDQAAIGRASHLQVVARVR